MRKVIWKNLAVGLAAACAFWSPLQTAGANDDLAAATQNPIASMVSLPFENTFDFGASNGDAWIMNVQPVVPVTLGDWNLVSRFIMPVADAPGGVVSAGNPNPIGTGRAFGLGDLNYSLFFSPANSGAVTWGVGPAITLPTATDARLGSEKWSAGPTAVILTQPKPWSLGVLARQLWSFAGSSSRSNVNQFMVQPFINYNMDNGWYLYSDPAIVVNWDASQRTTLPLGGGVGRIFKIGDQAMNVRAGAFYNVVRPDSAPEAVAKFTVQFLFPK